MTTPKAPVTFVNGISSRKDVLGVISIPDSLLNSQQPVGRVFFCVNRQWGHFADDLDLDPKSVAATDPPDKAWWVLGKNGEVVKLTGTTVDVEQIDGAGLYAEPAYGYVNTIKNVAGELYVCGYRRQVYHRRGGTWTSIAADILTRESARGFFDLDGTDGQHLYAVGWHGEIYFFDGRRWHRDDSPTNVHLASVRCVGPDDVWIAGNQGTVLHGRFGRWDVIQNEDIPGNWYCVEEFNGTIYLAGNALLGYVDGNTTALLDPGLGKAVSTHRLHAKDGILWSIGEKHVLAFDGSSWTEIPHPDNTP